MRHSHLAHTAEANARAVADVAGAVVIALARIYFGAAARCAQHKLLPHAAKGAERDITRAYRTQNKSAVPVCRPSLRLCVRMHVCSLARTFGHLGPISIWLHEP